MNMHYESTYCVANKYWNQISVWNRHIFVGDSIRVSSCEHSVGSEIFVFLSKFHTPLPVPVSRPITPLELWPIRRYPSPDFIEDGSIRISSANLNSTWLIVFYPPNPSLVGISILTGQYLFSPVLERRYVGQSSPLCLKLVNFIWIPCFPPSSNSLILWCYAARLNGIFHHLYSKRI